MLRAFEKSSHTVTVSVMKTIKLWSLLRSRQHLIDKKNKDVYHDSASRLLDIIILITSLEPLEETQKKEKSLKLNMLLLENGRSMELVPCKLTLEDLVHADVPDKLLHGVVFQVAVTSVHLECLVANLLGSEVQN